MKRITIFALAVLFFSACQKEQDSTSPVESDLALKNYSEITNQALLLKTAEGLDLQMGSSKKDKDKDDKDKKDKDKLVTKSLKSFGSGTISYTPNGCGAGTLKFKSTGTAVATHLGRLKQTTSFCIDGATGQVISPITGVGRDGNGDSLYYTFVGTGIDAATGFTFQDYIFTGGTGRFKNASGTLTLLYQVNTPTNYAYTGTGSITLSRSGHDG